MIITAQDHPGYLAPVYRTGLSPPFHDTEDGMGVIVLPPPAAARRCQPTPYTRSYIRDIDGALMVEIPGLGCYVSETWAVQHRYLTAGTMHEETAKEARALARKDRKAGRKEAKAMAFQRKQKRIEAAKAREELK